MARRSTESTRTRAATRPASVPKTTSWRSSSACSPATTTAGSHAARRCSTAPTASAQAAATSSCEANTLSGRELLDRRDESRRISTHGRLAVVGRAGESSLDEEHLRILRQRPEGIGDELLEAVGDVAHVVHRDDHRVAHVEGLLLCGVRRVVFVEVRVLQLEDREVQLLDERLNLAHEVVQAGG